VTVASGEDHYFPPGRSIARMVHGERSVGLLYGQRALLIGALEPLTYTGTMLSTRAANKPFKRLARTAKIQETVFLGTRAEADEVLAGVHALHETIEGELPEAAGVHAAGTPYSAFDPELMLWTLSVIADSGPCFYELFVDRLAADEREELWQEYVRFGELFGMPRDAAPASHREFRAWWDGKLGSDEMHLTDDAREIGYSTAFEIPLPSLRAPAKAVHDLIMLGSLPPRVRELYGIGYSAHQERAFRATIRALRGLRPLTPRVIREGYNTSSFRLVARTERRRLRRGDRTPQVA
jgi:uncharacterized protein (DUF2236 family)